MSITLHANCHFKNRELEKEVPLNIQLEQKKRLTQKYQPKVREVDEMWKCL